MNRIAYGSYTSDRGTLERRRIRQGAARATGHTIRSMDPRTLRHPVVVAVGVLVVLGATAALLAAGPVSPPGRGAAPTELRIHRRSPSGGPAVAAVPDVTGRSLAAAEVLLRAGRFRVRVVRRSDPTRPADVVLAQRPAVGTLVAPEVTLVLIVNAARASS